MSSLDRQHSRTILFASHSIAVIGLLLVARLALAADYVVTKFDDTNDGTCGGDCSLREAIIAANAAAGADTIVLSAGTYQISLPGIDEDACSTGDLDLLDHLTIKGVGRESTYIDGGAIDRVLHIPNMSIDVNLMDLSIVNGDTSSYTLDADGGGIYFKRSGSAAHLSLIRVGVTNNRSLQVGGGMALYADTLVYRSIIRSNSTTPGAPASGGGISIIFDTLYILESEISDNEAGNIGALAQYDGTVIIERSTVSGNSATFIGGIRNFIGDLHIRNSTISGNSATGGDAAITISGTGATLAMEFSTVADNSGSPGGILNYSTVASLTNTIVANNIGGDCNGDLGISGGRNLSSDATCGFTGPGDLQSTDPMLQPLQDNGGPTETHALEATSPAIDAAGPTTFPTLDQRGYGRPADGDGNGSFIRDMGAFEHAAVPSIFYDGFEAGDSSAWSN